MVKEFALLVTGGIAALKAPMLARTLRKHGADVVAFLSAQGARYVTEETMAWCTNQSVVTRLTAEAEHLLTVLPLMLTWSHPRPTTRLTKQPRALPIQQLRQL